jgi:hypothetical protein
MFALLSIFRFAIRPASPVTDPKQKNHERLHTRGNFKLSEIKRRLHSIWNNGCSASPPLSKPAHSSLIGTKKATGTSPVTLSEGHIIIASHK